MNNNQLKAIFDRFAGREVEVVTNTPLPGRGASVKLNPQDEAVTELRKAVEDAGYSLRVWLPNTIGTMDYRTNRVNVSVNPDMKGVYRIGSFRIG